MRDIKCINIVAMYKSAMCTCFILSVRGLGSASHGFADYLVLRSGGYLETISEKVYD
jgi:hypothetical protein